ncbi:transcription factor IIIA [Xylaria intraflava]|nr:transcription factor IIIA [Xylaria intraflava]
MKRFATNVPTGPAPGGKRLRTETGVIDDDDSESDNDFSDTASPHTEPTPTNPVDTPITPASPARRYPSEYKTILCTYPGCNKAFNRPARLAAHLRSHNNERPFKCTYAGCDKDYIEEKHLTQHVKAFHQNQRDYHCLHEGCGRKFTTNTRLNRHNLAHEGRERFRCRDFPPCNKSFRKHQTLQRHIRTEHEHKPAFECEHQLGGSGPICGQGFETATGLKRHQEREHGEDRFWCDECANQKDELGNAKKVGFPTLSLLQVHMKQSHVHCVFCNKACYDKEELGRHVESEHTVHKPVEERKTVACTWPGCTKMFTRKSNLNVHIRSAHEGVRYVCGDVDLSETADLAAWSNAQGCGQPFSLKMALENHVRYVHLMHERPAPKNAAARPVSSQHRADPTMLEQLTGVGESSRRTLPCRFSGCQLKFTYSGDLQAHIQAEHSEEQAILDRLWGARAASSPLEPSATLQDIARNVTEYAGGHLWTAADSGMPAPDTGLDQQLLRDESEMQQPPPPYELDGLIDPSLTQPPL